MTIDADQYLEWLAEEAENCRIDDEIAAKLKVLADQWIAKWPKYCKQCNGWGGHTFSQSVPYGMGSASFDVFDLCDREPVEQCHRCGENGLDEEGNGPCKHCGWNCDDGLPQL